VTEIGARPRPPDWPSDGAEGETWIRIVTYDSDLEHPESRAAYLAYTAKNVVRVLQGCAGFRNGYWAEDTETGRMAAITIWESRETIEAADPKLDRLHEERLSLGVRVVSVDNFKLLPVGGGLIGWIEDAYLVRDRLVQDGASPLDNGFARHRTVPDGDR
jgi:hypothetical protein